MAEITLSLTIRNSVEYSWFGHTKQGSALVKVGQTVQQGDVIASIGASGSSLFPHLHYELRDDTGAKT